MPMHPKPTAPTSGPLVPSLRCLTSLAPSYQFAHPALGCVSHQELYRVAALRATPRPALGLGMLERGPERYDFGPLSKSLPTVFPRDLGFRQLKGCLSSVARSIAASGLAVVLLYPSTSSTLRSAI